MQPDSPLAPGVNPLQAARIDRESSLDTDCASSMRDVPIQATFRRHIELRA
jgi:hypothetical protein